MPKKQETASGRPPRLPEVAITLQDSSSATTEIKLSVEEENALLRERNRQLEAENALLREREIALARDGIETLNTVTEALRAIQPGKETARFLKESERAIKSAEPDFKPFIINARIKRAATMIRESPAPAIVGEGEVEDRFTYSTKTRTENRALALVDYMKRTETPALKSTEARHVLQEIEGHKLDRKIVHRALNAARGFLRASSEVVGGVSRIVLQSANTGPRAAGGGRPVHPDWNSWRYVTPPDGTGPIG